MLVSCQTSWNTKKGEKTQESEKKVAAKKAVNNFK
jgi:hypothetical protein